MLKKPDLILYDWDGTLVDTLEGIRQGINLVRRTFGMTEWTIEDARHNIRKPAREIFPVWFGARSDEALGIYFDFISKNQLSFVKPMEGAQALLEKVAALNITQGIVSNKRHDFLLNEIEAMKWGQHFAVAIGAGVVEKGKPAPDSILHAIQQLPQTYNTVWYVGDTDTDMQAAAASGCAKIFIRHGCGDAIAATQENADLSILDCPDLQREIEKIV